MNYIPAYCMLQFYRVFVHSQALLKVLSVGPLFLYRGVSYLLCLPTTRRFSWRWLLNKLKSHCLVGGFVFSDFYTFGNCSVDALTRWQKSACTSGRSMASSHWRALRSWSATLHIIHPRHYLSVVTSLLFASNCTVSLSSWYLMSCRVETGVGRLGFYCWSTCQWES